MKVERYTHEARVLDDNVGERLIGRGHGGVLQPTQVVLDPRLEIDATGRRVGREEALDDGANERQNVVRVLGVEVVGFLVVDRHARGEWQQREIAIAVKVTACDEHVRRTLNADGTKGRIVVRKARLDNHDVVRVTYHDGIVDAVIVLERTFLDHDVAS